MKRFRSMAGLALAVALVLVPVGPTPAGNLIPFSGDLEGDVTRTPAPPFVNVDIDATGTATHLGRFDLDVPHVVNPVTRTAVGQYRFVAANGDRLNADFTGQSTPIPDTTFLFIEEHATIVGGTGRFASATGSFTAYRLFDTAAGTTVGWFDGAISRR